MTYSRWYDMLGIISCLWIALCLVPNSVAAALFAVVLAGCTIFFTIHFIMVDNV